MSGGIFICYRRDDSAAWAGRIYDRLVSRLEREQVFIDVDNIEPGLDFVKILSDRVGDCDALIAVIGKDWLIRRRNRTRLDDPNDFVRIEIEAALTRNIRVIPVLVDGATMPREEALPEALKALARRQKIDISHTSFDSDAQRLIKALAFVEEQRRRRDAAEAERLAREQREEQEAAKKFEDDRRLAEAEAAQRAEEERLAREERQKQGLLRLRESPKASAIPEGGTIPVADQDVWIFLSYLMTTTCNLALRRTRKGSSHSFRKCWKGS